MQARELAHCFIDKNYALQNTNGKNLKHEACPLVSYLLAHSNNYVLLKALSFLYNLQISEPQI